MASTLHRVSHWGFVRHRESFGGFLYIQFLIKIKETQKWMTVMVMMMHMQSL
jgi:hypothetical protein